MAVAALADRVNSFAQWHYEIDLGDGVVTPIFDRTVVNRHKQRERYFFDPLVTLCGGSLAGKRVLDIGCNAGYWSLKALDAGADFVLGVDGREMHIDQANLVMEAMHVDPGRYRFELGNVFDWEPRQKFNIVLCLGLLYHVARPIELLERCAAWGTDILVLDTSLSLWPGAAIEIRHEPTDEPRMSVEYSLVMVPTRSAVLDMLEQVGYPATVTLRPRFSSWEGAEDFQTGSRRTFLAAKKSSLSGLDVEADPPPSATVRSRGLSLLRRLASIPS